MQTRSSGEGRGLGLFTTRSIPAYSEILREAPLILLEPTDDLPQLYEQFISLRKPGSDEALQRRYLALSHQEVPQRDQRLREKLTERGFDAATVEEMVLVASIMQTNAFNVDVGNGMGCNHRALFPQIARINHSCVPNAHVCFYPSSTSTITAAEKPASSLHHHRRRQEGRMVVHALRNLHEGEEVQIAYFSILLSRPERQTKAQKWGFTCRCPACELPTRHDNDDDGKSMHRHEQVRTAVVDFTTKKTALLMQQQQQQQQTKNHRTSSSSSAVKQITNLITLGHNTISQVLDDDDDDHDDTHTGGFHPTLPDLYSNLSELQARALLLLRSRERKSRPHQQHDEEVEKEDVISSLQLAAIWEAKLTGRESPATKKRLLQLEKCAARQDATTRSPRIVAGTGIGAYAIEWMPPS